ncbi:MAG TPA: MotA/TolQ/ExbB proton channel family protein [Chromatiales bacterium]|nr:MotA/TolQ/ExbB proton channel family protein [Chromatiales bacterium]
MLEIIRAGGWLMVPILLGSVLAMAIVLERLWSLRTRRVMPPGLLDRVLRAYQKGALSDKQITNLREGSPLGRILAAGLAYRDAPREVMKEVIEDTGRHVAHGLERYLNTLGTIAAVSPLLGLLGTVLGMIQVFSVITSVGVGDPTELASGISQALITTAAGISVAVPALIFHRYFRGKVNRLVVEMEAEALKLVEMMHARRVDARVAA